MAKARCLQAISLPWCRIGVTSALCEAIQIAFRSEPRRSIASSKEPDHSRSSTSTAVGGKRTSSQVQRQQLHDPLNVICARSARSHFVVQSPTWLLTQTPYGSFVCEIN